MGFFDGFIRGFQGTSPDTMTNEDILEILNDEDDEILSSKYRKTALQNTDANYGWYTCPKCGKKFRASKMDADHIVPKSKGGDNSRYNLQLLCYHCNRSKNNKTDDTEEDLLRRYQEIQKQDAEDLAYLNRIEKMRKLEKKKASSNSKTRNGTNKNSKQHKKEGR